MDVYTRFRVLSEIPDTIRGATNKIVLARFAKLQF